MSIKMGFRTVLSLLKIISCPIFLIIQFFCAICCIYLIMVRYLQIHFVSIILLGLLFSSVVWGETYSWTSSTSYGDAAAVIDIRPPIDFRRIAGDSGSYEEWLRHLPLKAPDAAVRLYDGRLKANQDVHFRVIDIDIGDGDLQQCADAVIRMRAEYLFGQRRLADICFNFTSGDTCRFDRWAAGYRAVVSGNFVTWKKAAAPDSSYVSFRKYLDIVFTYAGSYSLAEELTPVPNLDSVSIGDIFIQGGFPGHAVFVVDMAVHSETGRKAVLLAQSYMPAQDIHILLNPRDSTISPWYVIGRSDSLYTPEWTFSWTDLMRFEN